MLNDRKDPIGTNFKDGGTLAKGKEKEKDGGKERTTRLCRNVGGEYNIILVACFEYTRVQ